MERAPLFEDVAEAPTGGEAYWLAPKGARIRVAAWPAPAGQPTRGTVLIFPGRSEYIEKFGPTASAYHERGFATLAIDWRGQGLADRPLADRRLGHVGHFDEYQRDVAAAVNLAQWLELPEPWYLVAHSMGGCIGLRALYEGLPVAAAGFSAPMWGIEIPAWKRPLAWVQSGLAKAVGLGGLHVQGTEVETLVLSVPFEGNKLTSNPERWDFACRQAEAHPNVTLGGPTLGWLNAALTEMRRLAARPAPAQRAVTFLGTNERVVDPAAIRRRMAGWQNGALEVIEGAEHEITQEQPETRARFYDTTARLFTGP